MLGVLYTSVSATEQLGKELIDGALSKLLAAGGGDSDICIIWSLQYSSGQNVQQRSTGQAVQDISAPGVEASRTLVLPPLLPNISFEDDILQHVKHAWTIIGGAVDGFLVLDDAEVVP